MFLIAFFCDHILNSITVVISTSTAKRILYYSLRQERFLPPVEMTVEQGCEIIPMFEYLYKSS